MLFAELMLFILLGVLCGIVTGLCPGLHVNLVAAFLIASSAMLLTYFEPLSLAVFVMSLAVAHTFLDTIPSVYLGAPDSEKALSILPAQKMLLAGMAHQAVKITILGTYAGLISSIMLIPMFILVASAIYPLLRDYVAVILILVVVFMLAREEQRFWSFFLFAASGALGVVVLSGSIKEPLLPMLSGLFGIPSLIMSILQKTAIPKQRKDSRIDISPGDMAMAVLGSAVGVFFIQFFPGLGPSQGAVISSQVVKLREKARLALIGAMGTMSAVFSLATFYALGKAKDGSIVAVSQLIDVRADSLILMLTAAVVSGSASVFLVVFLSRKFSSIVSRVNYSALAWCVIAFVAALCLLLDGWLGILVLFTSASVGMIAVLKGISRNHAMACLIVPVIFYLL